MLWCAIAILLIVLIAMNRRFSSRRSASISVPAGRPEIDIDRECENLVAGDAIEAGRAARLWRSLAAEYGIDPAKLRSGDRLGGELAGIFRHPDYDPFPAPLFLGNRPIVEKHLPDVTTWGELILAVSRIERETGRSLEPPGEHRLSE